MVSLVWGTLAIAPHEQIKVRAAPLYGHWGWYPSWWVLLPIGTAVAIVVALRAWDAVPWTRLVVTSAAGSVAWAAALGAAAGPSRLVDRLSGRHGYEPFASTIENVGAFLSTFTERIADYPVHVRAHPPGATLVPWALDRVGLGGAGWFQVLNLTIWGAGVAFVLVAVREAAGETWARRAAPGVVLLPGALWATQPDATFAGVGAAAVAVTVIAVQRGRAGLGLAGGVLFAAASCLTYGAVVLAVIPVVVAATKRSWTVLVYAASGAGAALLIVWVATGFWWLDGLGATHAVYRRSVASERPSVYFALAGNPGALALAVGPATVAALVGVRRVSRRVATLPLAALLAVVVANVSLMSKAEVERIWLLFMPWLAVGIAVLPHHRRWLAVQVAAAIGLHLVLRGGP
jgi:hypothetical protein